MNSVILNAPSGANISLIVELAKKLDIDVITLSAKELEEIEDMKLLHIMNDARAEGDGRGECSRDPGSEKT